MVPHFLALFVGATALKVTPSLESSRPHGNARKRVDKPFCAPDSAYHAFDWGSGSHPGLASGCRPRKHPYRSPHAAQALSSKLLGVCGKTANGEPAANQLDASVTCGCCSRGSDHECAGGGCTCAEDSHPMSAVTAEAAHGPRGQLFTAQEALQMLRNRNVMFVGDASTRRLMWALCAFLNGWHFQDRFYEVDGHPDFRCPLYSYPTPEPGAMADANVALEFFWAPSARDFQAAVHHRAEGERWDLVVTNIYHWDRLHHSMSPEQLVYNAVEQMYWRGRHMIVPILLMTPSLVSGQPEVNAKILRYAKLLKQANFTHRGTKSKVVVSDSSSWMRASEGALERHTCLGEGHEDATGISVDGHFSQALRVQQLLTQMGGILNFGPLDTFGKTGRWKKLPFLKAPTQEDQ